MKHGNAMGWQELGSRLIFPYLRGVPFLSKFEALTPQQKADVLEFLLTPDLVGLFEVSRISLHANLSPSQAFTPSTLGRAKSAKTRHRQRVGGRHRRLAVFEKRTWTSSMFEL